jgi:hypothetical protein
MSVTNDRSDCGNPETVGNPACESYPSFDLDWHVDDPDAPSELTITEAGTTTTAWLSIDPAHAVAIEELR